MDYRAQPQDVRFLLDEVLQAPATLAALPAFAGFDAALEGQVLEEAARFVDAVVAPLNRVGDETGARRNADGSVTMPPGFAAAYRQLCEGGWPALSAPESEGGQGLPFVLEAVLYEWLTAANHGFTLAPGLLHGAAECLRHHADEALRAAYLPRLASGEWLATMALTEPQAGSDLGRVRTRAVPGPDGSLRVTGSKIFISGGEHDLTDNIVHLVLCRLPDAPAGPKGLSLALVPKVLPDGSRNAVHCERIEEKMGLHASPTCALAFDGATGWLVGAPGEGLRAMFRMMNAARLHVALQGIALLDAAWQRAAAYAAERRQMRAPPPAEPHPEGSLIAEHPAVARILDTQRAWIDGARLIAYRTAVALDLAQHHPGAAARAAAQAWCGYATPVLKAACTEQAFAGASACLQVFGGHGYCREWGIEQTVRDARITLIYEGTNEIQAIDLLVRKVLPDAGAGFARALLALRDELDASREADADAQRRLAQLRYATTNLAMAAQAAPRLPYEVADDYLRLAMLAMLGWAWARIEATPGHTPRHAAAATAFRRWVLPEFDMRLGIVKRACEAATGAGASPKADGPGRRLSTAGADS